MATRPSISTLLLRPLAAALAAEPEALEAFLSASDLTAPMLADAEARVTPTQFCVAWAEATRLRGDPGLALRLAAEAPPNAFGIVEYVCRSAPTLRAALEQWVRYLGILDSAVEVGLVDLGAECALRVLTESEAPAPASHELCFALLVRQARALLPDRLRITAVRFSHHDGGGQLARHRAFFGSEVRFGAPKTELVFAAGALDAPLPTADPDLLAILLPLAEEKRSRPTPDALFTDQIRRALRAAVSHDDAQLAAVARRLGTTARSVQRRLKDEGTAFQTVRDDVRRELADRYLAQGMSSPEISFLLGFSEPSAFFRAFRRWTGLTPFERRAALSLELSR